MSVAVPRANVRPIDRQRAALAALAHLRADATALDLILRDAGDDLQGPAGLILALTETAAALAAQLSGGTEAAEHAIQAHVFRIATGTSE